MHTPRILQLQSSPDDSTAAVGRRIEHCLVARGLEVQTVFLTGSAPASAAAAAAPRQPIYLDLPTSSLKGLGRWRATRALRTLCRRLDVDLLIAHRFKPLHILLKVGARLGLPLIGVIHGAGDFDRFYRRALIRRAVARDAAPTRFVAVSAAARDYLLQLGCGFSTRNTQIIPNAIAVEEIDAQLLPRAQARAALGLADDAFIIGTIGRLVPVKAHQLLIEAFARVHLQQPQLQLAIIGAGREHSALQAQIEHHRLQGRVHLLGAREQGARYLQAFDVFALPSRSEGLPLALLEAMAARLPVIASSIDAITAVVGTHAVLHASGDATALARAIEAIVALPASAREAMGASLRQHLEQNFAIDTFARRYHQLVDQLAQQAARA